MGSGKSIIIIGAGLAGLATGVYAQMNGYRAKIFEYHHSPGGVCTAWERRGYTIDGAIRWLVGTKPSHPYFRMYEELGIIREVRFFELEHYITVEDEATGQILEIGKDLEKLERDMKEISPDDGNNIEEMIKIIRAGERFSTPLGKPQQLMGPLGNVKMMWQMRSMLKYIRKYAKLTVGDYLERFESQWLRKALLGIFPSEMPALPLFITLAQITSGQCGLPEGGSLQIPLSVEKRYRELGGEVQYKAKVEEIIIEDDKAVGIRLADGSEHHSDIVVSAADGYSTIFEMLGGKYIDSDIEECYQNLKMLPGLVMVSFGVNREFPNSAHSKMIYLKEPIPVGEEMISKMGVRIFNYDPTLAEAGKTVVQAFFESDFDWWAKQREDEAQYKQEKLRIAGEVLRRLEARYPDISLQVEMKDVATPYTTWRYTLNHKGAYEGWFPTLKVMSRVMDKTLPGLLNLYMVGQWVQPPGGVPTVMLTGRKLIQLLCHYDKNKFVTTVP